MTVLAHLCVCVCVYVCVCEREGEGHIEMGKDGERRGVGKRRLCHRLTFNSFVFLPLFLALHFLLVLSLL